MLHTAAIIDEAAALASHGVTFAEPQIDLAPLRAGKDKVVGKLTSGLASMARARKVQVIQWSGVLKDPNDRDVRNASGQALKITFKAAIIAVGFEPVGLPFLPNDPRIVDSTGPLTLPHIPKRMLVIGGGSSRLRRHRIQLIQRHDGQGNGPYPTELRSSFALLLGKTAWAR